MKAEWVNELSKLKDMGYTQKQCEVLLGKSRNQVAGAWNRLNGYQTQRKRTQNRSSKDPKTYCEQNLTEKWADRKARRERERLCQQRGNASPENR